MSLVYDLFGGFASFEQKSRLDFKLLRLNYLPLVSTAFLGDLLYSSVCIFRLSDIKVHLKCNWHPLKYVCFLGFIHFLQRTKVRLSESITLTCETSVLWEKTDPEQCTIPYYLQCTVYNSHKKLNIFQFLIPFKRSILFVTQYIYFPNFFNTVQLYNNVITC